MSDLLWFLKPPYTLLTSGVFILCLALIYTYIGKAWARTCWVYRAKEPRRYWFEVAMYYLVAVGLLGLFLKEVRWFLK
jgi:hypothetical protein